MAGGRDRLIIKMRPRAMDQGELVREGAGASTTLHNETTAILYVGWLGHKNRVITG
jgi:hypothetical protein